MKKWHYKNVFIKGSGLRNFVDLKDLDNLMNRMGADGWEFVSTIKKTKISHLRSRFLSEREVTSSIP
jgi:hypothetical protein